MTVMQQCPQVHLTHFSEGMEETLQSAPLLASPSISPTLLFLSEGYLIWAAFTVTIGTWGLTFSFLFFFQSMNDVLQVMGSALKSCKVTFLMKIFNQIYWFKVV